MRKLLPLLCIVLFSGSASLAQNRDYPKWDFTAAYTLNILETPPPKRDYDLHGFTGGAARNFKRYFALEGDVTYTTKTVLGTRRSLFTYLAGPRFTKRYQNKPFQPFVHALFGGGRLSGFGASTNGWAGKFGVGLDMVASKHVAVRLFEYDYYRYHGHVQTGKQRLDNFTLTFGIRIF